VRFLLRAAQSAASPKDPLRGLCHTLQGDCDENSVFE
jgi:hypothetical protein